MTFYLLFMVSSTPRSLVLLTAILGLILAFGTYTRRYIKVRHEALAKPSPCNLNLQADLEAIESVIEVFISSVSYLTPESNQERHQFLLTALTAKIKAWDIDLRISPEQQMKASQHAVAVVEVISVIITNDSLTFPALSSAIMTIVLKPSCKLLFSPGN
jgi:hypothetical protein